MFGLKKLSLLLILVVMLQGCSIADLVLDEYPTVTKAEVEKIRVGMVKEEVDKVLGVGNESFHEDENGREYISTYKATENNDMKLIVIEYDVNNKVKEINY